jgi:hypothetical protein
MNGASPKTRDLKQNVITVEADLCVKAVNVKECATLIGIALERNAGKGYVQLPQNVLVMLVKYVLGGVANHMNAFITQTVIPIKYVSMESAFMQPFAKQILIA